MAPRLFDLNIEEVLEDWEVSHAIREVISNALDEQTITNTQDVEIDEVGRAEWVVRDFGRGLRVENLTLNEDEEKRTGPPGVIGKFGVGLKDALATFHRRGVDVEIRSPHGTFNLTESGKHGFDDITTLHVAFDDSPNQMTGTEILMKGVTRAQMDEARSLFMRFNGEVVLERTEFGEILESGRKTPRIYIVGVFAGEEPDFLFSYNVTDLTASMKKRLNRERVNVGRTTYADRIRSILRQATSDSVIEPLAQQIRDRAKGTTKDEVQWIEVAIHALTQLHLRDKVLFVTEKEMQWHPDMVDHARADGMKVVTITGIERKKLKQQAESGGVAVRMLEMYVQEFNESFEYSFVEPEDLTPDERAIFDKTPEILDLIGVDGSRRPPVLISETMRLTRDDTEGVWDPNLGAIVVRRGQLVNLARFSGTLLHEAAHAFTGTVDATREFESVLTAYLGETSSAAVVPHLVPRSPSEG